MTSLKMVEEALYYLIEVKGDRDKGQKVTCKLLKRKKWTSEGRKYFAYV